jgi:ABC-type multidrug transport system ATPase subunit
VDRVSFRVEKGTIFGLIGPDGAGKSTVFQMLATLRLPDAGTARINDMDVVRDYKAIRRVIGYMPGRFSLYPDLSVRENLRFFADLFGTSLKANRPLIQDIYGQLERFNDRRAGKLSGGMKQKLALCCALVHNPVVLLLDEPTTGVDPVSRREFWDILSVLKQKGMTIVVSTPYMDEAVRCDHIALMQQGSLLSTDTPAAIREAYPDDLYQVKASRMHALVRAASGDNTLGSCYGFGEYAHVSVQKGTLSPAALEARYAALGFQTEVRPVAPTIEDCFIRLLNS